MRIVLVGSSAQRARLRAQLNGSLEVVGEYATLAAAHAADLDVDAVLVPPTRSDSVDDSADAAIEEPLTPREVQVLELLAEGLPNKAIADRLQSAIRR